MKKMLSLVLTLAMVLSLTTVAWGATYTVDPTYGTDSENSWKTVAGALQAAADSGDTIKLEGDVTESVVIDGKVITLDLNGKTLTNDKDGWQSATITVLDDARLTVIGNGTVNGASEGGFALLNNGETVLNGGTYTVGKDTYAVVNIGNMTINDGVTITNAGVAEKASALVTNMTDNQYTNFNNKMGVTLTEKAGDTTINGGTIESGRIAVNNEAGSTLEINGGSFSVTGTGSSPAVVRNSGTAEITDGTFTASGSAAAVLSKEDGSTVRTTISGGEFTGNISETGFSSNTIATSITGGTFSVKPDDNYLGTDVIVEDGGKWVVGDNTDDEETEEEEDTSEPTPEEIERDRIVAAIKAAADGDTVTLDVKKLDVVSRFIADAMSGKNVNLEYTLGEETVTVNGKNVPKTPAYRVWYSLELFAQFA